jgi:hypothetical protein
MTDREKVTILTKDDLKITWFSGSGGGGQGRNKHANCCRIHHPASGVTVTGQDHKERPSNQRDAWRRLMKHASFKLWLGGAVATVRGQEDPEKIVDKLMREKHLRVDVKDEDGRWVEAKV